MRSFQRSSAAMLCSVLFGLGCLTSCGTTQQTGQTGSSDTTVQTNADENVSFYDGEQTIDLRMRRNTGEVALYRGSGEECFARISLPEADGKSCTAKSVSFSDVCGDSREELQICCVSESGNEQQYTWSWNRARGEFQQFEPTAARSEIDPYVIKADVKSYLSEQEIALFQTVIDAIFAQKDTVTLTDDYDSNLRILSAVQYSPYYFFVKDTAFTEGHRTIALTYAYDAAEQENMRSFMDSEMLSILNRIICYPDMNELEKTLAVYQYFSEHITYDYTWLENYHLSEEKFMYPDIEIYQALSTGKGVCHSYAYLCEFALQQLGVECLRISGTMTDDPEEGHMWIVVKINGDFYHCDPTWESTSDNPGGLRYFGMTDTEREETGVTIHSTDIDGAYGEVVCSNPCFSSLRDVSDFSLEPDHTLSVKWSSQQDLSVYDTQNQILS